MQADRESMLLPARPRRRRRVQVVRFLARLLCALFALVGVTPVAFAFVIRSSAVQLWATEETTRILHEQGIEAKYQVRAGGWPPAIELRNVVVQSSDGGEPFLTARAARVRPKLFALLSGKLRIEEIVIESPRVRAIVTNGRLQNLAIEVPKSDPNKPAEPLRLPFDVFSISDAEVVLEIEGVHVVADEIDMDVTATDSPKGSIVEAGLQIGTGAVHRTRVVPPPAGSTEGSREEYDDDALCNLETRVRWDGDAVTVRRLSLAAVVDVDARSRSLPSCSVPYTDKRRLELSLSRVKVLLPHGAEPMPAIDGHIRARAPIALVERIGNAPDADGWVLADVDVHYAPGMNMPDVSGHVEAHDARVMQYRVAKSLDATVDVRANVVRVPRATVAIAGATVTLTDVQLEPLAKGMPIRARAEIRDLSFAALMADLGVSEHAWVEWEVKELSVPNLAGTLDPLHLDADFTGHAPTFAVYDRGADNPLHTRLVHVENTDIAAHLAVRPDSVQFRNPRVTSPKSAVAGDLVLLGYHGELVVKVPSAKVDLAEIGPLGSVHIGGHFEGSVNLGPNTDDIVLESDATISDLVFGEMPLGNVSQVHAHLTTQTPATLALTNVKGQKGASPYELPQARLLIRQDGLVFDADIASERFGLRDILAIFHLEEDPRFAQIDGRVATTAQLHLALGGAEDKCGGGYVTVRASARISDANLYGEKFEDGNVDFDLHWYDQAAGLDGADLDVSSFVLHKAKSDNQGRPVGNVVGSATVRRGGSLSGNVVLEAVPLNRIQTIASLVPSDVLIEGATSGLLTIKGSLEAFEVDGAVDVTPIRIHGVALGASNVRIGMRQFPPKVRPTARTRCGGPLSGVFDKEAYLANTAATGDIRVSGELFDGQIVVPSLTVTQQKASEVAGALSFRRFDIGAVAQMLAARERRGKDTAAPPSRVDGLLTGEVLVDFFKQGAPELTKVTFAPRALSIERDGNRIALEAGNAVVRIGGGKLEVEPMTLAVELRGGLAGAAKLEGTVDDLGGARTMDMRVELSPVDLRALVGIVPKVESASGTLAGKLRLTGPAANPDMDGRVTIRNGEVGVPPLGAISGIEVDLRADRHELRVDRAVARVAGGAVSLTGHLPISNLTFGTGELAVKATSLRFAPADGISVGIDADLRVAMDVGGQSTTEKKILPRVTGDVTILAFDYTRPMSLSTNLSSIGSARRTQVDTYDAEADFVSFDVAIRARQPLRIRNNVADVSAIIDSGSLQVTGTNQRFGVRGSVRALPGGHMRLPFGSAGDFDIRTAQVRFTDSTRLAPIVELQAVNEYRRGSEATSSTTVASYGGTRGASSWRMNLHAYGDANDLRIELTSDPALSQEDIILLLTIGMTRAEIDQLKGGVGAGLAFEALNAVSGASSAITQVVPIVDDFRFGSAYSPRTGRSEPQLQVGKRLSESVRADVSTSIAEDRQLRANVQFRLSKQLSLQTSYDNVYVSTSPVLGGNVGLDLRWRLEFE